MIMWVFVRRSWCSLDGLHQVMFTKLRSHGLRLSVFTVLIILVCIYCSRNINHYLQRPLINHSRRHNKSRLWFITHPSNWKNPSRLHFLSYSLHCAEIFINRERRGHLLPVKTSESFFPRTISSFLSQLFLIHLRHDSYPISVFTWIPNQTERSHCDHGWPAGFVLTF